MLGLGLLALIGCTKDSEDTGDTAKLVGSGDGWNGDYTKIDQLESLENYSDGRDGPFLFMNYGDNPDEAVVSMGDSSTIYFENAGMYNNSTQTAEINTNGEWHKDGTWYLHNDILIGQGGSNSDFTTEKTDSINEMLQEGIAIICQNPETDMSYFTPEDICLVNGQDVIASYLN